MLTSTSLPVFARSLRRLSGKGAARVAVVGGGPAGFYVTGSLRKLLPAATVTVFEAEPVPFGLVRFGVAPDHPEVKNCIHQFETTVGKGGVRFAGGVRVPDHVAVQELLDSHHAVIFCTGAAASDNPLMCDSKKLPNVVPAREVVHWYNGHPDAPDIDIANVREVAIVGIGNVALDIARIFLSPIETLAPTDISEPALAALRQSRISKVRLIGRRGPTTVAFTIKEFRELLRLPNLKGPPKIGTPADFAGIDEKSIAAMPRPRRRLTELLLRSHREGLADPTPKNGGVEWELELNRTPVGRRESGALVVRGPDGAEEEVPSQLLVSSLGYRAAPIAGLPFDAARSLIQVQKDGFSVQGQPRLYACGWCAHGPKDSGLCSGVSSSLSSILDAMNPGDSLAAKALAFQIRAKNRRFEGLEHESEKTWTGPFCFVQAADTQLGMIHSFRTKGSDSEWSEEVALTRKAVAAVNRMRPRPRFFVVCGDLVDAMPGVSHKQNQIRDLKGLLSELDPAIPAVCICGNHDIGDVPTPAAIADFRADFGDDYFSFWVGGVKFIVLNSQFYHDDSLTRELRVAQDEWLDAELAADPTQPRTHLIGLQHIAPFVVSPDEEKVDVPGNADLAFNFQDKVLRRAFLDRLQAAGMGKLFCGHYHRNAGGFDGDLEVIVTSAIGCQLGADASGLRIVRVFEDRVEHRYEDLDSVPESVQLQP